MPEYVKEIQHRPLKRKYHDSLMNYIMTQLPLEHEQIIKQFTDRALDEAYANGLSTKK